MENIVNTLNNSYVILGTVVVNIILLILYISSNVKLRRLNKEYRNFMKKIGKGEDIDENLKVYIKKVEKVEKENKEIIQYCEDLNKELAKTIRKVGIVRYNAFKDVGSNLSFTLALLDNNNNGVDSSGAGGNRLVSYIRTGGWHRKQEKEGQQQCFNHGHSGS